MVKMEQPPWEGETQYVSQGPAAAIIPIKQLGTNGGGYFGVNSSHPLENPTYLSNMIECWSILIIPMAMAFAFGFYVKTKKLGYSIYGVMLVAFLIGACVNVSQEMGGNPRIDDMEIAQENGSMEGKEIRLGPCHRIVERCDHRQSPPMGLSTACMTLPCLFRMIGMLTCRLIRGSVVLV